MSEILFDCDYFCRCLFKELKKLSIRYCVLRNYNKLPDSSGGSDLDIWVHYDDVNELIRTIKEVSCVNNYSLVSYIKCKYSPKLCYLSENGGIQIDLFIGDISSKYGKMISQSVIMNHIIDYHGVSVIDNVFANLIAFIKEFVNNKKCGEKYCTPLFSNSSIFSLNYLYSNLDFFTDEFIQHLFRFIQNGADVHSEINCFFSKAIFKHRKHFFLNIWEKISRFIKSPGYVIAVIGTDGCGKSTIINGISPILNEAFHNGVYYHHLRPHLISDIGVLIGKREESTQDSVCSNPHSAEPSGLIGSLARWSYYLIDYSLGYMRRIWLSKHTKSHVHIFDRYYYDYYIDPYRLRVKLPRWIIRLGELFVPSPDIILCLGGNPNIIYERKQETSLEEVSHQNEKLRNFCNIRKNAVWIDTTQNIDKSVKDTMKAIQDMMAKRFANVTVR